MAPKLCKYNCGTMLEGFDEEARKFKEAATGGLHTKERCQEAKAKLEAKNDHGNELVQPNRDTLRIRNPENIGTATIENKFVDHTTAAKGQSKVKIFADEDWQVVEEKYNRFLAENNGKIRTQGAQFQLETEYAIALYYEEVK